MGVGIATGTALATNMGSTNCDDHTMVGDSINIASRLQGKAASGEILVTGEAYNPISVTFPGCDSRRILAQRDFASGRRTPVVARPGAIT